MMKEWLDKIRNSAVLRYIKLFLQRLVLPGFDGMNFYDVSSFFWKGLVNGALVMRASALSYDFFLAVFPTVLFFFTLIPYIPIDGFQETLMGLIEATLPPNTFGEVKHIIEDIIIHKSGGWLSISFALALIFSTNGVSAVIAAFNQTYHRIIIRSYLKQRLVSLFLVLGLSGVLILAIALIVFGTEILNWISYKGWVKDGLILTAISIAKWIVLVLLMYIVFSSLYYFGPAERGAFRFISAGSSFSTVLTIITSIGFDYYVSNFSRYNALYGSIGTLIVILLWINFNSIILLLGFELNASISAVKKQFNSRRLQEEK